MHVCKKWAAPFVYYRFFLKPFAIINKFRDGFSNTERRIMILDKFFYIDKQMN